MHKNISTVEGPEPALKPMKYGGILIIGCTALLLMGFALSGYQTWRAEGQLGQARTNTQKGDYVQAATQLDDINIFFVWPTTSSKISPAKAQNAQFQNYAKSLRLANAFVISGLLDDASAELAKINKDFPQYSQVEALQKSLTQKKAAANKQAQIDAQPLPGPVQVVGDSNCQTFTRAAFNLLKTKAAAHYAVVQGYLGIIECVSAGTGVDATQRLPKFLAGAATSNAGNVWYAGAIVHEACHSKLYRTYKATHLGQPVPSDVWTGEGAEKICLDTQYDALTKLGATQSELSSIKNAIKTEYFKVDQSQRWW